jgi:hypothetical protein
LRHGSHRYRIAAVRPGDDSCYFNPFKNPKEYTDMPRTLFVVEDKAFTDLPKSVQAVVLDETTKLLKFVPKFQVVTKQPNQFPAALDFSDSVVRFGDDVDLGAFRDFSSHQQFVNILVSVKQKGFNVESAGIRQHTPPTLERIGVGWMSKEVKPIAGRKLAVTMMGGMVSVQAVQRDVVEFLAHGRKEDEIIDYQKTRLRKDPDVYRGSKKAAEDNADLKQYDLLKKALKDWPPDAQKKVGLILARAAAHEARHEYTGAGHAKTSLGANSPDLTDDKNYADFSGDDKTDILNKIAALEKDQGTATIQLETIPKGQPFPF